MHQEIEAMTKMMKHGMRAAILAVCAAALTVAPVMAQGGGGGGQGGGRGMMTPDQQVERLNAALTLTADQQTSIKAILEASMKDQMALRDDTTLSQDDRMAKSRAIREAQTAKIKAVLTGDQKTKYDAMMAAQRQRAPGGPPPPPPPAL
jgi:Spy/CpxP family protein refolding chaperone